MDIRNYLCENTVLLDGGMGTLLQARGLSRGELPERWNVSHPDEIISIHKSYFDAGSNVVNANTFGANSIKYSDDELEAVISAALDNARAARDTSCGLQPKWVALDIGPTGKLMAPFGELDFEDAVEIFAKTVRLGVKYGADLVFIETMSDIYETKAALLAVKENSNLPVFVSNAYEESGRLMTGADPKSLIALLEGMGADAIGVNCSFGPKALRPVVENYLKYASVPVLFKPNAGLPSFRDGKSVFDVLPDEFAKDVKELVKLGVRAVGGCCGTTPEYISAVVEAVGGIEPLAISDKCIICASSYSKTVHFGNEPVLVGEGIDPDSKEHIANALRSGDIDTILDEAYSDEEDGVGMLKVKVGIADVDEVSLLTEIIGELQATTSLPIMIEASDPAALEPALRRYNGKAAVRLVNGSVESMAAVLPIVKKYGALLIASTVDENGIPADEVGAVSVAERMVNEAGRYGIPKKDILIEPVCAGDSESVRLAVEKLGYRTYTK